MRQRWGKKGKEKKQPDLQQHPEMHLKIVFDFNMTNQIIALMWFGWLSSS